MGLGDEVLPGLFGECSVPFYFVLCEGLRNLGADVDMNRIRERRSRGQGGRGRWMPGERVVGGVEFRDGR